MQVSILASTRSLQTLPVVQQVRTILHFIPKQMEPEPRLTFACNRGGSCAYAMTHPYNQERGPQRTPP